MILLTTEQIKNEYFEYLYQSICGNNAITGISWRLLLWHLFNTPFRVSYIQMDENRLKDGLRLRYVFGEDNGYDRATIDTVLSRSGEEEGSVLEVMIALSCRIENEIMASTEYGDRMSYWFWIMVDSLGLNGMIDNHYDVDFVDEVLDIFMDREYDQNGKGSLFYCPQSKKDFRNMEIWYQMCEYLNETINEGRT